ncbi:hypothetical protein Agub_g7680 [Astrephomene gubernaculifera]|uniref:Uncharacterized protein n=1 Tax=Astrephomene gubernaculifera TaxID=47775 RepID=A0AAD3DQT3_9CHLO|nr:hypothetical protein Agub_g7680 [Astrephomene gubernaculifera]
MALPGVQQKCYICSDAVTEADYRRELTCSYGGCPGTDHAYHEECITEYLRKLKFPTSRLIGYPCPVLLDNGRPCTGRITATHHKQPLNQKKKQKRVEAAAAAAAATAKLKQPAAKAKDAKGANGVGAATAAMRPAGEAALRQAGVNVANVKSVASSLPVVKGANVMKTVAPGSGAAARLSGAVSNNVAMAPERVVRQRVIPGWSPGDEKAAKMSSLEQQRAMVAALRAEAKSAVGRSSTKGAVGGGGGGAAAAAGRGALPPASAFGILAADAGAKGNAGMQARRQQHEDDDGSGSGSDDSDVHAFSTWRDGDSSDDGSNIFAAPPQDFNYMQEDFPAFPTSAATQAKPAAQAAKTGAASAAPATPAAASEIFSSSTQSPAASPLATASPSATPSELESPTAPAGGDAAASALEGVEGFPDDETDPIVRTDPVFATEDGTVVVQDVYGNYVRMEDVYGPTPELIGFSDEAGNVSYYVVVRQSAELAAQEHQTLAGVDSGLVVDGVVTTPASVGGGVEGPHESSCDVELNGAFAVASNDQYLAVVDPPAAPVLAQHAQAPTATQPQQPAPQEEGDLNDLFALCLGGGGGTEAEREVTASAFPSAEQPFYMLMPGAPSTASAAGAAIMPASYGMYGSGDGGAGFNAYGYSATAAAAAPAGADGYTGSMLEPQQPEADDVDSLLQLLCV